jgi:hypothetical protein
MSDGDVFDLAASVRAKLRKGTDEVDGSNAVNAISAPDPESGAETPYAVNAVNAISPAPAVDSGNRPDAVSAIDAVSEWWADAASPGRPPRLSVPAEMPDPGARCGVHNRLLTFAEQLHGRCSWCEWQERGR